MRAGALIAGLLAGACGTASQNATCAGHLCGAFSVHEEADDGEVHLISPARHLAEVDYKSRLRIIPDRAALEALSTERQSVLPWLSADVRDRLESIPKLMESASRYVELAAEAEQAAARAHQNPSPQATKRARDMILAQAATGDRLLEVIEELATARARLLGYGPQDQIRYVASVTDPLLEDASGNEVILNVQQLAEFLNEEFRAVSRRALEDQRALEGAGTARLRIRAHISRSGGERAAVHVSNYDNIEDVRPAKRRRVSFRMSEEERKRVEQGWKLASRAAAFIREAKSKSASMQADLKELARAVLDDLSRLTNVPKRVFSDELDKRFDAAIQLLKAQHQDADELARRFREHKKTLEELAEKVDDLRSRYSAGDVLAFIEALTNLETQLSTVVSETLDLQKKINGALDTVKEVVERLRASDKDEEKKLAKKLEDLLPESAEAARNFYTEHGELLVELVAEIKAASSRAQVAELGRSLDDSSIDPRSRALPIERAPAATIKLNDTPADRGTQVVVTAELVSGSPEEEIVLEESEMTYRVERFGVTSSFNAGLVFVKRVGDGEETDLGVNFAPAPSLSWVLRYRSRESAAWNSLGLGLGLGVAAVEFQDGPPQLGIAPEASLFGGVLYGGYGWNLQVDEDRDYWYLGIGILETVKQISGAI